MTSLNIGLIQMAVSTNKENNLLKAQRLIHECAVKGADLVMLPEMFCCPYSTVLFPSYAEERSGMIYSTLAAAAQQNKIYLIGGSMPERDASGRIFNTSFIFDPRGKEIGYHRKIHLFDIDVAGGQYFRESDTLAPGNHITVVETEFGPIGVAVCYDFRFPELARIMVQNGARLLAVPGAFNMTTGPAHWEILFRMRAVDNQVFTCGCAPARDEHSDYISYANSMIVDPWGRILQRLEKDEGILIQKIDFDILDHVRKELPLLAHRRSDIYETIEKDLTDLV